MYKSFYQNSFPTHDNHNIYSVYLGIRYTSSIYQWEFQDPKLKVPIIYMFFFAYVREDPQKYSTQNPFHPGCRCRCPSWSPRLRRPSPRCVAAWRGRPACAVATRRRRRSTRMLGGKRSGGT